MCKSYFWIMFLWLLSKGVPLESSGEIICGKADKFFDSCFNSTSNSRKYQKHHIPNDNEQVVEYCNQFELGIRCYNEYSDKCLSDVTNRRLIESELMPAKNFYRMLCKDESFKKDYLKHRDCYGYIEKDWTKCTRNFRIIIDDEFTRVERERKSNIDTQYMHFCCARYGYENCVYNSARAKCKPTSAKFTKNIVELLTSGRQFKDCAKIEESLCSGAKTLAIFLKSIFFPMFLGKMFIKFILRNSL